MIQQEYTWKERLKDSSWVTVGWDWFMTFLGRVVEAALWITMIFSCYQLIPGAPQPAPALSNTIFIIQFVALDVGGIGLNKLAQQQGLPTWCYTRVLAYVLIGLTLVTVSYAGLQHVASIPSQVTNGVEATLVILRSVMTVLYGQAIHDLKQQVNHTLETITELEAEVSTLHQELDSGQREVSSLRHHLGSEQQRVSSLQKELDSGRLEVSSLRKQLHAALIEVDTLKVQVEGREQEITSLQEMLGGGQERQESRFRHLLKTEQERVSTLQEHLSAEQQATTTLRTQLHTALGEVESLRGQVESREQEAKGLRGQVESARHEIASLRQDRDQHRQEVSSLRVQLGGKEREVSSLQKEVDSGQEVSSRRPRVQVSSKESVQVSSGQRTVDSGRVIELDTQRRRAGQDDTALGEQIKKLLGEESGLSDRAMASRLGCSPTTVGRWRKLIEAEASTECVNE